jgi:hypothetical protein
MEDHQLGRPTPACNGRAPRAAEAQPRSAHALGSVGASVKAGGAKNEQWKVPMLWKRPPGKLLLLYGRTQPKRREFLLEPRCVSGLDKHYHHWRVS